MKYTLEEFGAELENTPEGSQLMSRVRSGDDAAAQEVANQYNARISTETAPASLFDTVRPDGVNYSADSLVAHNVDLQGVVDDFVEETGDSYSRYGNQVRFGGKWVKRPPMSGYPAVPPEVFWVDSYVGGEKLDDRHFIEHILKRDQSDPERIKLVKAIDRGVQEREELEQFLESEDLEMQQPGAGKIGETVQASIQEKTKKQWEWLPEQDGLTQEYLDHLKKHDPILSQQLSQMEPDDGLALLQEQLGKDKEMQVRMQANMAAGRFTFEDPELYNWANRRGMIEDTDADIVGEVGRMVKSMVGGGFALMGDVLTGKFDQAAGVINEGVPLLFEDYDMLLDGAKRIKEKWDQKDWEDETLTHEESQQLHSEAIEAKRQFLLRGLYNQSQWMNVSGELAARFEKEQQAIHDRLMGFTVIGDLTNFIPVGGATKAGTAAFTKGLMRGQMRKLATMQGKALAAEMTASEARVLFARSAGDVAAKKAMITAEQAAKSATKKADAYGAKIHKAQGELVRPRGKLTGAATEFTGKGVSKLGDAAEGTGELLGRHLIIGGVAGAIGGGMASDWDPMSVISGAAGGHFLMRSKGFGLSRIGRALRAGGNDLSVAGRGIQMGRTHLPLHQLLLQGYNGIGHLSPSSKAALQMYDKVYSSGWGVIPRSIAKTGTGAVSTALSKEGAQASALQAGIGYVGSGGETEGAIMGAGIGVGLTGIFGAAKGFIGPYGQALGLGGRNKNEILSGQVRLIESIYSGEKAEGWQDSVAVNIDGDTVMEGKEIGFGEWFSGLNNDEKKVVANQLLVHPDMEVRVFWDEGRASEPNSYHPESNTTFLNLANPGWGAPVGKISPNMAHMTLGHETGHFIGHHEGMDAMVINQLLGRPTQGIEPKSPWIARDANGNAIIQDRDGNVVSRQDALLPDREGNLRKDLSYQLSDEGKKQIKVYTDRMSWSWLGKHVQNPKFRRFLNHPMFLDKLNKNDPKAVEMAMEMAYNEPLLKEYMAREVFAEQFANWLQGDDAFKTSAHDVWKPILGRIIPSIGDGFFDSKGQIKSSIFDKMPEYKGLKKLIREYNKEIASGQKRDIEETYNTVNLAPEDYAQNPDALNLFDASPSLDWVQQSDGSYKPRIDPKTGKPIVRTPKQQKAENKKLQQHIFDWFQRNPPTGLEQSAVQWRTDARGRPLLSGRYLPDALLDELESSGRYNPKQLEYIRAINDVMKDPDNNDALLTFYQAATGRNKSGGRSHKALAGTWRTIIPHGWTITKGENLLLKVIEPEKLLRNAEKIAKRKEFMDIYNGNYQEVAADMLLWINNAVSGRKGAARGLGEKKRNLFRVASGLGKVLTQRLDKDGNVIPLDHNELTDNLEALSRTVGSYLMSFRADRINRVMPAPGNYKFKLDEPHNFDAYDRVARNYYPGTPEQMDTDYLKAVEDGDMETAQRMVDAAAKRKGYTARLHHGTPTGGFTVFKKRPTYLSEEKDIADIYQQSSASSIRSWAIPEGSMPETKTLYVKAERTFDTRNPEHRKLWDEEFYMKWGNGTPLSDRGLPDWTDGADLHEWMEETNQPFDSFVLDEGGLPNGDGTTRDRGVSLVSWEPSNLKSADPVTYDNDGNVIPPSQRFKESSDDIRYFPGVDDAKVNAIDIPKFDSEESVLEWFGRLSSAEKEDAVNHFKKTIDKSRLQQIENFTSGSFFGDKAFYHGSNKQFEEFKPTQSERTGPFGSSYYVESPSFFFTDGKSVAWQWADNRSNYGDTQTVYEVYLSVKNPIDLTKGNFAGDKELWKKARDILDAPSKRKLSGADYTELFDSSEFVAILKNKGYDGAIIKEEGYGDKSFVVFDSDQILIPMSQKITPAQILKIQAQEGRYVNQGAGQYIPAVTYDNDGNVIPPSQRFDTKQDDIRYHPGVDDAKYLELAKDPEANRAELQALVIKAAKAAGYTVKAYHVTNAEFTSFDPDKAAMGGVFWFTESKDKIASNETGAGLYPGKEKRIIDGYLKVEKTAGWDEYEKLSLGEIEERGFDSVKLDDDWIIFNPSQIKSADLITRDDAGNIIPPSQRFKESSDDIRYFPGVEAKKRDEALANINNSKQDELGRCGGRVEITNDPDEDFIEHHYTHPQIQGSASILVNPDGTATIESFIELTDNPIFEGYQYPTLDAAKEDILEVFTNAFHEYALDEFGGNAENKISIYELFEHFFIPEGFENTRWEQAGTGSWYMDLYDAESGEKTKLSIRDHTAVSTKYDSPDLVEYVTKEWEPREVKEALDKLEKRVFERFDTKQDDIRYHPDVDEKGTVSQENMPGYNSGVLRGLHTASPSEKMTFHKAIQKALHYKKGDQYIDIIAEEMGVDANEMATGISAYLNSQGFLEMNPATQITGFKTLESAELYALLHGYFTYQEAVAGYHPEAGLTPGGDWGDPSILADFIIRKKGKGVSAPSKATAAQVKKIHKIIEAHTNHMPPGEFGDPQAGDIAYYLTDKGFRLMFLDLPSNPDMNSQIFADIITDVKASLKIAENDVAISTAKSFYQENQWGSPSDGSGQAYRDQIQSKASETGSPDVLGRLERRLGPILQPIYDKFAKKGLGNPGLQPGVAQKVAGITLPRTMSQLSDADALTIANKIAPLKDEEYSVIDAKDVVEDYMAWNKTSAQAGDQFFSYLKKDAKIKTAALSAAKRSGKEDVTSLKSQQPTANAELEGVPRKDRGLIFKNNDKLLSDVPKSSDVKPTISWDKSKETPLWVVGSTVKANSYLFPNIILNGDLGKAIETPDHHKAMSDGVSKIHDLVSSDPEKAVSREGYYENMKKAGASSNALIAPSTLEVALMKPELMEDWVLGDRLHGDRKIETRQNALDGLDGTLEFREAIGEGKAPDKRVAAFLHLWGILSRMLPPLDQEGLWLRMLSSPDVIKAIDSSVNGDFKMSVDRWKELVEQSREATPGAGKIGNNATSNANSFVDVLKRLNGNWGDLAEVFATSDAKSMRSKYWETVATHGSLGIKNKVVSFMGLTTGIPTWVGDRWQYVFANLPMLERLTGNESHKMFTYDRFNTPTDPTSIYSVYGTLEIDNAVFSNLFYEYINTALENAFQAHPDAYKRMLGDHVNPGGFHWVTWNAIKNEPVGHSSLSILLDLQKKSKDVTSLEDLTSLILGQQTYTEGMKGGKNVRLVFDKGEIRTEE